MARATKNVQKAFAVASCVGAALRASNNGTPKLSAIQVQANRAMQVFNVKDPKLYWSISGEIKVIWEKMAKKHNNLLDEDEITVFVEMMCMMIPPKDFKDFMGVSPYRSKFNPKPEVYAKLAKSVLDLDAELNALFGTSPYTMVKPKQKIQKQKKQRDKAAKKAKDEKISRSKRKEAERRSKARSFLRDRINQNKQSQGVA